MNRQEITNNVQEALGFFWDGTFNSTDLENRLVQIIELASGDTQKEVNRVQRLLGRSQKCRELQKRYMKGERAVLSDSITAEQQLDHAIEWLQRAGYKPVLPKEAQQKELFKKQ